jgi:glycosyltransferase involved in cell wall biosynthesis
VLEAMAMAKPTVTTPTALAGIEATPERDILVAENAEAFAAQTVRALQGEASAVLGATAKTFVTSSYSWESQLSPYDALIA